ncbi:MAG: serpin family protein [Paludibacter sp.]|nr:serpin family protein [Paludibacter sp.]
MKKLLFLLLPGLLFSACEQADVKLKEATPIPLKAGMEVRVQQDNEFALDLFRRTIASTDEKNVFISPLSVSIALGMAWNGADNDTKTEMETVLKMSGMTVDQINDYYQIMQSALQTVDPSTKLKIANSLWYRQGFAVKNDYLQVNKNYFNAEIRELDFAKAGAVDVINQWCADKTNNLIKEPLDQISAEAVMYLINAIYFKGIWVKQFDKKKTFETNFSAEGGVQVKVDMMQQLDTFAYYQDDMAQYLDMPYGNKAFSMTAILPVYGKTTNDVLNAMNMQKWGDIQSEMTHQKVQVYFPKFKTKGKYELKDPLMEMGMIKAFSDEADFSRISDWKLIISRILHSTYCDVNEEGTEAAAVTIIEFENTAMPEYPVFNANRPFIFIIREKSTGVILFMGKMGKVELYE